ATGNLISDGTLRYGYGNNGRLSSTTGLGGAAVQHRYNGLGQRAIKSDAAGASTYFVYNEAEQMVGEYNSAGTPIQETVYLEGTPVAVIKSRASGAEENAYYVYADHLATPRIITRVSDNKMVWRWDGANPFGEDPPDENPNRMGNFTYNLRFPGQYFDRETNLHYNYYRDYDPQTGRYVQSDPIGLEGGINTYEYVNSDPLSNSDLYGLKITPLGTRAERARIWKGIKDLTNSGKSAARMVDILRKSPRTYTIELNCDGDHYGSDKNGDLKPRHILWNSAKTHIRDGSEDWHYRPSFIGLGHELIHAWAEDAGRKPQGDTGLDQLSYDEHGTVGIPRPSGKPTANYPFTENMFRKECGCAKKREAY
ncbi:M91 family zinc metallopeptidase, partial [Massilia sp. DJPM01]|uniref:RHS repeat-associated core domain-containing protein n=1 Tax=Massilia sp. DJPM01 TaxID=3024404 RepID=UPI00259D957C